MLTTLIYRSQVHPDRPPVDLDALVHRASSKNLPLGITGILLQRADAKPNARAQCSWCRDVTLPNDVVLYVAKRSGPAGRKGDAVGTLICEDFEYSTNMRRLPPLAYEGFDREAARDRRIDDLRMLTAAFAAEL